MNRKEEIKEIALSVLDIEAKTIENLKNCIDDDFLKSVDTILNSEGRLVVTGIGKSALVGQKLVATLNSTGTAALFMHAADAVHGDLGMLRPDDIVLAISKSGETPEMKSLLPMIVNFKNTLIVMTSQTSSYMASVADFTILTPVEKEADRQNLAPTASTIAQAAMGDALAMSLKELRGFTSDHFARVHPGGILGKKLHMKVSDLIAKNESPKIGPDDALHDVILEISSKRLGATAVIKNETEVIGIITDGDLRRMMQHKEDLSQLTASDIMSPNPKIVNLSALAIDALSLLKRHSISQLIVMDKDRYCGILHVHDLIREGMA